MTTTDATAPWPTAAIGLILGAALSMLFSLLLDLPLAICLFVGAGLGLIAGATVAAQRRVS